MSVGGGVLRELLVVCRRCGLLTARAAQSAWECGGEAESLFCVVYQLDRVLNARWRLRKASVAMHLRIKRLPGRDANGTGCGLDGE